MTIKYKARRFAVGKGVPIGEIPAKGRNRLVYMGPKGGMYYIGTNNVITSREKRLVVRYFRVYLRPDNVANVARPPLGNTPDSTPPTGEPYEAR